MSHIVEARTNIKNPDRALLRQVVEIVAGQHAGGRLQDFYVTYEGARRKSALAISTSVVRRGMGISVKRDTGELAFTGDPFGCRNEFQEIQQQIVQTYVSLATMQALQALGYQVESEDGEAGQVVLTGVTYA